MGETIEIFVTGATKEARELNKGAGTFIAMKLIAARGKIQVQAQSDEIELTADQSLEVTSAQSHVQVAGKEHVTLTSGGGFIRIKGRNVEIHCPGTLSLEASNFLLEGPTRMDVPLPEMLRIEDIPERQHAIRYRFVDQTTGLPTARHRYRIQSTCGKTLEGVTDKDGWAEVLYTREPEIASTWVAEFPIEMDPISRGDLL